MSRDLPARYLDVIVRLLPGSRKHWGHAMRAELASLESASERRRFALGCTRAVLSLTAPSRAFTRQLAAVAAACLVLAAAVALAGVIGAAVPVLAMLALLVWLGRRTGAFGPVAPGRAARAVRSAGFAIVGSFLLVDAVQGGVSGLLRPDHDGRFSAVVLILLAAAFLAITADGSRLAGVVLSAGAIAGLASGTAAFALLPFAQNAEPLARSLPGDGSWLALIVCGAPVTAALVAGRRTNSVYEGVEAALCSATFAALVVALLGLGAVALLPGQIPHLAEQIMMPGTSAAARQAEDAIAASDRYEVLLVFGTLLATGLWAAARPPARPRAASATRPS